jgi:hypothetical protein
LIHPKLLINQWWPQSRPVVDGKGNWQALAYFGKEERQDDVGLDFEIAAATFDEHAEAEILKYHENGKNTGKWLPISFPKTTSQIAVVTVKKVR